ncbi:DUF982 domain-containing protein [Mesorhizobium sp. ES1-1]|uniref:DUF982 domain-containing protein n=1 Tax=Mesorhizobium sp. ES1-1 TaxID=2876629 RepID=UPI001CCCF1D7|nr:DUF982 domain-containing protein [Mesorhizobium sp. ES1-1]MBZ9678652.1 DUF982 domain-containing protein [Mesorhizobium sp. ES1-1]
MNSLAPLAVRFIDARSMTVSTLTEARDALDGRWCNKQAPSYLRARQLIAAAQAGACRPAIAMAAFERAAREQGLIRSPRRIPSLRALDSFIAALFVPKAVHDRTEA